jgi:hypothetical protein
LLLFQFWSCGSFVVVELCIWSGAKFRKTLFVFSHNVFLSSFWTLKMAEVKGPYTGNCYCGDVCFEIEEDVTPRASLYCHCDSCRRAHSAPLYCVVFVPSEKFHITKGQSLIKPYKKDAGDEKQPTRNFCTNCGTRVFNSHSTGIGFFPSLLKEELQRNLPAKFKPTCHWCSKEAVLDLSKINDEVKHL